MHDVLWLLRGVPYRDGRLWGLERAVCGLHVAESLMGLSLGLLICHPISFCPSPTSLLLLLCRYISIFSQAQGTDHVCESM